MTIRVIQDLNGMDDTARGAVVVIGNFDGVHKGHQTLIGQAAAIAADKDAPLGVLMFEPHPAEYFHHSPEPMRLAPLNVKSHLLDEYGVDYAFVLSFDEKLAHMVAPDFVEQILAKGIGARHIIVGYDFRFGRDRQGDTALLAEMGGKLGMGLTVVEAVSGDDGAVISSTLIRQALKTADVVSAAAMLGHPWYVEGPVIQGDQRGRTIGFPTANVAMDGYIVPALGVYAIMVEVMDGAHKGTYPGVANVGKRPTFDKQDILLEAHLFDFEGDLYGATVRVSFIDHIRAEQKFDGLDALKAQIAADCDLARQLLGV